MTKCRVNQWRRFSYLSMSPRWVGGGGWDKCPCPQNKNPDEWDIRALIVCVWWICGYLVYAYAIADGWCGCGLEAIWVVVPAERCLWGDYETSSVRVCVRPDSKFLNLLLFCHFLADFDYVCFIWYGLVGAAKLQHRILKFINYANLFKINENVTSLFCSGFLFRLFYLIGLGGGFKTSTQNFEIH